MISFRSGVAALAAGVVLMAQSAVGAEWPNKPITVVVPFAPGGPVDTGARLLARKLQATLGQPIVVENKPGGGGLIGTSQVINSKPDGYTLLLQSASTMNPSLVANMPFDVMKDMEPVAPAWVVHYILFANETVPATDLKSFAEYAGKNPGKLNYGMGTLSTRLAMDLLKNKAGLSMTGIPYQGSAPTSIALLSNEIQVTFDVMGPYRAQLAEGKVHALAVTGPKRNGDLPSVPTVAEDGYPDLQMTLLGGFWAPKGVPKVAVAKFNDAVNQSLQDPEIKSKFLAQSWDVAPGSSASLGVAVAKEIDFWEKAAAAANYVPE